MKKYNDMINIWASRIVPFPAMISLLVSQEDSCGIIAPVLRFVEVR